MRHQVDARPALTDLLRHIRVASYHAGRVVSAPSKLARSDFARVAGVSAEAIRHSELLCRYRGDLRGKVRKITVYAINSLTAERADTAAACSAGVPIPAGCEPCS